MSEVIPDPNAFALTAKCGCRRALVKRQAPAFDPETGEAKLENGAFVMEEVEEIQEIYCDEHTITLIERQQDIQKLLAEGKNEEALLLSQGASPFMLEGHKDDE